MRLTELFDRLGVEYRTAGHEHCRPGWAQTDCPWCSPRWSHFRLGWNLSGLYANCWACGRVDPAKTLSYMTGEPRDSLKATFRNVAKERAEVKPRGVLKLPKDLGPLRAAHKRYLEKRGFDPDLLERLWGLKGTGPLAGKLSWRIFIPVVEKGELVSWVARAIVDDHATRYRSASPGEEIIDHKTLLFGEDLVKNTVLVTEGPFDVFAAGPGAVCTFGTGFRRPQVRRIARYPRRVICFDADGPGEKRAGELADLLEPFPGETLVVHLRDGKDLAESRFNTLEVLRDTFLV